MSAKSRAITASFADPGEIPIFFKEMGIGVPSWLNHSYSQSKPLIEAYFLVGFPGQTGYLDAIDALLSRVELREPELGQVLQARDLFSRYSEGFQALMQMPKNQPKHRTELLAVFETALDIWSPIFKTWQHYGDTPLNLGIG